MIPKKNNRFNEMSDEDETVPGRDGSDEEVTESFSIPELDSVFKKSFHLEHEEAISLKKNYILHLSAVCQGSEVKLGVGTSKNEAYIYSLGASLQNTNTISAVSEPSVGFRFAPDNPSLLYVGSTNGEITLWDLRNTTKYAQQYKDTSNPKESDLHERRFCCFDVNCEGRFLCAGTEVTDGDAYLLFWDTRQNSLLGGYWNGHTDDVTQVCFHPSEADSMVTASTDGLINLYDVSQSDENDALLESLNSESSVEKVKWHTWPGSQPTISCVTHTSDVQLWRTDDFAPYASHTRPYIAAALRMSKDQVLNSVYIADVHSTLDPDTLLVLAGSNLSNGTCLRTGLSTARRLAPRSNFEGNKQIVRCSWFDPQSEVLVTGGEAGILSVWKPGSGDTVSSPTELKATSKLKEKKKLKVKPY